MAEEDKPRLFSPGVGKRGMTQLHFDAYCGNLRGLHWCLENGMDPNATDNYRGYTAAHWVVDMANAGGDPRDEMLKVLADHGADLNIRTPDGTTPLMLARELGSAKLASALIALGAHDHAP